MTKKDKITITIDQEVNTLIREIADKNDRPLSTEINRALKNYIKEEKEKGK
jgi:predicted transcriptional regulator